MVRVRSFQVREVLKHFGRAPFVRAHASPEQFGAHTLRHRADGILESLQIEIHGAFCPFV